MKILEFVCHEGVQEMMLRQWLERGHEVYLTEAGKTWNNTYFEVPEGVIRKRPSNPDLISVGSTPDLAKAVIHKIKHFHPGIPIVMVHHWFPSEKKLAGMFYRRATNITLTSYQRQCLLDIWNVDSELIYCPIDADVFRPHDTEADPKLFLTIGNGFVSRPDMGWQNLVDIMAKVYEKDRKIHFQILGINPEIKPGDFPNVSTLSLKPGELPAHEAGARAIIFPTIRTLIPQSLIGAMAIEKTVVSFELDTVVDLLKEGRNGHLISCYDTDAFADRILELSRQPEDKVLVSNARKDALGKCDHRVVADQLESVFNRLVG